MIDEKQIQEAIAYYGGKVEPNRNDAVALAACYILQDHLSPGAEQSSALSYSTAPPPAVERAENYADDQRGENLTVGDYGSSDFLQAVRDKRPADVWAVMDELMETLAAVNPRVYDGVMRQIRSKGRA